MQTEPIRCHLKIESAPTEEVGAIKNYIGDNWTYRVSPKFILAPTEPIGALIINLAPTEQLVSPKTELKRTEATGAIEN